MGVVPSERGVVVRERGVVLSERGVVWSESGVVWMTEGGTSSGMVRGSSVVSLDSSIVISSIIKGIGSSFCLRGVLLLRPRGDFPGVVS